MSNAEFEKIVAAETGKTPAQVRKENQAYRELQRKARKSRQRAYAATKRR